MRNKPQQLSSYAKRLLREQDNQMRNLSSQLNEWKEFSDQLQLSMSNERKSVRSQIAMLDELKSMNLFQLILWWIKK